MLQNEGIAASLHRVGLKSTNPRIYILEVLVRAKSPLRVKDICKKLTDKQKEIDMVTIYRSIETLSEKGMIRPSILVKMPHITN